MRKVPRFLQPILWSVDVSNLDLDADKVYIINQILSHGRMKDFKWLLWTYTLSTIIEVFLKHPIKDYRRPRFKFVKNFILPLSIKRLDERLYVKNTPRVIRPRKI